jgi:tetratricopeptide (TPR) repeat protein
LTALCATLRADVIQLKNGNRIAVDSAREVNGRIEYTIGDNTYVIPKSSVQRIDVGGPSTVPTAKSQSPSAPEDLPKIQQQVDAKGDLSARVIHDAQIDVAALKAIESEGVPERSAAANFYAAYFEEKRNNYSEAARYLQAGLIFSPNHIVLLEHYVAMMLQLGRNSEALVYADRLGRASPQTAESLALLGYAYYKNDRTRDAVIALKKSLALRPDEQVAALLQRVDRETKAEAEFRQQESPHFVLRYEGSRVSDDLRNQILAALEEHYKILQNDLGSAPKNTISISLYTDEAFFDITQAPAWTSALNDGKLRIPISGITGVTPELVRVLRHELTHSFIQQITHGHVPQWLNEGIAQLEEPKSISPVGVRLASLYVAGQQIPLNRLEGSFLAYSQGEASVAYAESLAAVAYIRAIYGMSDLARILVRLGQGESIEAALRNTIHGGYAQLESEITDYLKKNYGG